MPVTVISTVGVVGLGTMGAGILEVFAKQGLTCVAVEVNAQALDRGRDILEASLTRAMERGKLTQEAAESARALIEWSLDLDRLADVDLVIEAVPERMEIKRDLFGRLDALCKPDTILATNTSSLSVTAIAACTNRPDRVVGMHFFNPAPAMKLVEVIETVLTDSAVTDAVVDLARACGKTPITVGDRAGFVANTLLISYLNDAIRLLESRAVGRDDLDSALVKGAGMPMGPLALADLIGLDVCLEVMEVLFDESRDPVHAPAPLLRSMVAAGLLGRKTARGFYTYERAGSGRTVTDEQVPVGREGLTPPSSVIVVGDGQPETMLIATLRDAGIAVTQVSFDEFDPALVPIDHVVLVGVKRVQRARDIAVQMDGRRGDVVGMQLMPPTAAGQAVEVVCTPFTSERARDEAIALAAVIGAAPTVCYDGAGQVLIRLLLPMFNDAVRLAESKYACPDDIDTAMRLGCGFPKGPVEWLETFTLKVVCDSLEEIYQNTGFVRHRPAGLLVDAAAYEMSIRQMTANSL
ncbi:MAG TPA: 3-hydroxybutyryl-CoA dehydrogenase [Actinobacteria bacterium]|nr:3-hydroxybutyryl-CoA dehydrogenase [Actinomycetota bacterium]